MLHTAALFYSSIVYCRFVALVGEASKVRLRWNRLARRQASWARDGEATDASRASGPRGTLGASCWHWQPRVPGCARRCVSRSSIGKNTATTTIATATTATSARR